MLPSRRQYYWIVSRDPESGKPYLIFGGDSRSEDDARTKALEMLGSLDFAIRRFPTRDIRSASRMLRGVRLGRGEGLHKSSERIGHDRTLRRRLLRRRRVGIDE